MNSFSMPISNSFGLPISEAENYSGHEGLLENHVLNVLRSSDWQHNMEKEQENSKDQTQDPPKA